MKYADFNYYQNVYLGDLITDELEYDRLAVKAGVELEYYTVGRSIDAATTDPVLMASCAVAEQLLLIRKAQAKASSDSGELQSETVGSYSRSYRSSSDSVSDAKREIQAVIQRYLSCTDLLYRGVGSCTRHTL